MNALIEIVELAREIAEANRKENYNPSVSHALEKVLEVRGLNRLLLYATDKEWERIKSGNQIDAFYEPINRAS